MRSRSEEGSYLRLVDVCITLNSRPRVIKKKKKGRRHLEVLDEVVSVQEENLASGEGLRVWASRFHV